MGNAIIELLSALPRNSRRILARLVFARKEINRPCPDPSSHSHFSFEGFLICVCHGAMTT